MGVGEDPELGEAISVTVIATGFDVEQQDDIVNSEAKKIIHTLEEEQKAVHDLTPQNIVHQLVDENTEIDEPVLKHTLTEEDEDEYDELDLIPTTNYIKNFNVFYEEVIAEDVSEDDFLIIDTTEELKNIEVVEAEHIEPKVEEDQFAMSFELPLVTANEEDENLEESSEEEENTILFSLDEEVGEIDVKDHIEVIPVLEYNKEGETRYSLDDYMELENKLTGAKSKAEEFEPKIVEDELVFERKTLPEVETTTSKIGGIDPIESPIEELLRDRADERRRKLKDFNYKFQNNVTNIDEIEKEPAYKRQGVELKEASLDDNKISKTSLSEDINDEIQLRSNNSFLHDNVD
jgi:cell division protein FtsZ